MFKQKKWDLRDLLTEYKGKKFENFIKELELKVKNFENFKKELKSDISSENFLFILKKDEELSELCSIIGSFVQLKYSEDVSDQETLSLKSKIDALITNISNRVLFFAIFWKELDDKNAKRIISSSGVYQNYLTFARKFRKHTLSEKEEKIINMKDLVGSNTLNNLYDMLTSKFVFKFKGKKLVHEQLNKLVRSPDPKTRELAYQILLNKYIENKDVIGEIYKSLVLDWKNENISLRGYKTEIAPRNLSNDIPDETIDLIFSVCKDNNYIFQNYFKLKAKLLGMKKIRRCDIYAPIGNVKEKLSYDSAVKLTLDNFKKISPLFYNHALTILESDHVNSELKKNKITGAYCLDATPKIPPYILLNYDGTIRDASTLAHEMGHGVHYLFASKNSIFNFQAGLPLAETASTFSETMMHETLMDKFGDKFKKNLLFSKLDDLFASIPRQIYFSIFEKEIYKKFLGLDGINGISEEYFKTLKEEFGSSVELSDEFKWEWLYVSHFFQTPFYTYAYSFGNLLAISIFEKYKKDGDKVIPNYIKILEAGSSKNPTELLLENGFDIQSREFWQGGFDFIKQLLKEANDYR